MLELQQSEAVAMLEHVVSAVVVATNESSKATKQTFTYDSPFKETGKNYILVKSDII
jgi:hypothetical protein